MPRLAAAPIAARQRAYRHYLAVLQLHRVHAASLRHLGHDPGQSAPQKQEAPGVSAPRASTAHPVADTEVRAASAQSDTRGL